PLCFVNGCYPLTLFLAFLAAQGRAHERLHDHTISRFRLSAVIFNSFRRITTTAPLLVISSSKRPIDTHPCRDKRSVSSTSRWSPGCNWVMSLPNWPAWFLPLKADKPLSVNLSANSRPWRWQ